MNVVNINTNELYLLAVLLLVCQHVDFSIWLKAPLQLSLAANVVVVFPFSL